MSKKSKRLISVIMPVYNGQRFLNAAIDSILSQTLRDFELIIINDGSTDGTEKIIRSYKDPRIVYVKNEKNLRLIKTLNKGIALAHGQYIVRMDADDISLPHRFETQLKLIQETNCDVIGSSYQAINEDGEPIGHHFSMDFNSSEIDFILCINNPIIHATIFAKTECLKRNLYYDSKDCEHVEDLELFIRMMRNNVNFNVSSEILYYYRRSPINVTFKYYHQMFQRYIAFSRKWQNEKFNYSISTQSMKILLGHRSVLATPKQVVSALKDLDALRVKYEFKINNVSGKIRKWCSYRKTVAILKAHINILQKVKLLLSQLPTVIIAMDVFLKFRIFNKKVIN